MRLKVHLGKKVQQTFIEVEPGTWFVLVRERDEARVTVIGNEPVVQMIAHGGSGVRRLYTSKQPFALKVERYSSGSWIKLAREASATGLTSRMPFDRPECLPRIPTRSVLEQEADHWIKLANVGAMVGMGPRELLILHRHDFGRRFPETGIHLFFNLDSPNRATGPLSVSSISWDVVVKAESGAIWVRKGFATCVLYLNALGFYQQHKQLPPSADLTLTP